MSKIFSEGGVQELLLTGLGVSGLHNDLFGRSNADCHPISAITGLVVQIADFESRITANELLLVNHESRIIALETAFGGFISGDPFLEWAM